MDRVWPCSHRTDCARTIIPAHMKRNGTVCCMRYTMASSLHHVCSRQLITNHTSTLAVVTKGQFLDLSFIQNPDQHGEARIVTADAFTDRPVWLFPFLPLSRRENITGWVFRAGSSLQSMDLSSENVPSFELWQENMDTSQQDYIFVMSGSIQAVDGDIPSVYEQTLTLPCWSMLQSTTFWASDCLYQRTLASTCHSSKLRKAQTD